MLLAYLESSTHFSITLVCDARVLPCNINIASGAERPVSRRSWFSQLLSLHQSIKYLVIIINSQFVRAKSSLVQNSSSVICRSAMEQKVTHSQERSTHTGWFGAILWTWLLGILASSARFFTSHLGQILGPSARSSTSSNTSTVVHYFISKLISSAVLVSLLQSKI